MASTESKYDDLTDADIDPLIDDAIPENTKKATAWGTSVLKGRLRILNFSFKLVEVSFRIVNSFASITWFQCSVSLCNVFNLNNKRVNALIALELSGFTCTRSLTMDSKFLIPHEAFEISRLLFRLLMNLCR